MSEPIAGWYVYVLVSVAKRRTYVGITTDPERRLQQHNGERPGGARSTRACRPWERARLHGPFETRGDALRLERALKRRRGEARLLPLGEGVFPPGEGGLRPPPSAQNSTPASAL